MKITIHTVAGKDDEYILLAYATDKIETYDRIVSRYIDNDISKILIEYDTIVVDTVDGRKITESGNIVIVDTLDQLKSQLDNYSNGL